LLVVAANANVVPVKGVELNPVVLSEYGFGVVRRPDEFIFPLKKFDKTFTTFTAGSIEYGFAVSVGPDADGATVHVPGFVIVTDCE
jgi:hypothetical protein